MRPVPGFPAYTLDETGTVYRNDRPLKPCPNSNGYLRVFLRRDGATHTRYVHRLMCEAFHGEPSAGQEVRHLNGARDDNSPSNLAWGDRLDQARDMDAHGTRHWGDSAPWSKLTAAIVIAMRDDVRAGMSMQEAGAKHGVAPRQAVAAITGKKWGRLPGAVEPFSTRRKFSPEDVRVIRTLRGIESEQSVADRYGVTRNAIHLIMRGKSYAHVI